jgi:hypothetical protein
MLAKTMDQMRTSTTKQLMASLRILYYYYHNYNYYILLLFLLLLLLLLLQLLCNLDAPQ